MPLDDPAVFKGKISAAIVAAYQASVPTVPTVDITAQGQSLDVKPGAPVASEMNMDLVDAIAEGVAKVVLEQLALALVWFPSPGLKAIVPPLTGEVQGTGRIK